MKVAWSQMARTGAATLALCLGVLAPLLAEDERALLPTTRPTVRVPRIPRPPVLDEFLDMQPPPDLADLMRPITGFVQRQPEDGNPASQKTDVYMGFDDQHLYVVFVAWDDEPEKIRARMSHREQVFADETVEIQLDTYGDQQRALSFLTNPFGVQWDAIWTEGQGFDDAWDTVWNSRGALTDRGYVVLMEIPFKSLRFRPKPEDEAHAWGVVLVRDIPRNNETSFWPRVSNRIEGRLNQAGTLQGFEGVAPGRNLWVIPYLLAGRRESRGSPDESLTPSDDADLGLDVKWVIKDHFTLDLTANPDFAQVESDEPVVTVNERFEIFIPERRPFFLENADFFETPVNLLFTRRIADPDGGARLTGRTGKYRIGAFVINDAAPGKNPPPSLDYLEGEKATNGIFRIRRDLPNQSNVGFIFTGRELAGGKNGVAGLDARIKFDPNWDTRVQAAYSGTRTAPEADDEGQFFEYDDWLYDVAFNREGRRFNTHIHHSDVGGEFDTWLGYVPRRDIRQTHGSFDYNFWPERKSLIRWEPGLFVERITNQKGVRLDETIESWVEFELRRRTSFVISGRAGRRRLLLCREYIDPTCAPDVLPPPDAPLLAGDYDFDVNELAVYFGTQFIAAVDFDVEYGRGRTVNYFPAAYEPPTSAAQESVGSDLTLRLGRHIRLGGRYLYTDLDEWDSGSKILTNQIARLRFDWQFNIRLSLRVILEHNHTTVDEALTRVGPNTNSNADVLLNYLINPWTAFYLGFNTNETESAFDPNGDPVQVEEPFNDSRLVFFKMKYLFRP
jgi:hypothetical protein